MGYKIDKSAHGLGVQLHVPPARASADSTAGTLYRLPEGGHHILSKPFDKFAGKHSFLSHHTVTLKRKYVFGDTIGVGSKSSLYCHLTFPLCF
jgi:hypothetical protein